MTTAFNTSIVEEYQAITCDYEKCPKNDVYRITRGIKLLMCSGCEAARYCNEECQKLDRKQRHKDVCSKEGVLTDDCITKRMDFVTTRLCHADLATVLLGEVGLSGVFLDLSKVYGGDVKDVKKVEVDDSVLLSALVKHDAKEYQQILDNSTYGFIISSRRDKLKTRTIVIRLDYKLYVNDLKRAERKLGKWIFLNVGEKKKEDVKAVVARKKKEALTMKGDEKKKVGEVPMKGDEKKKDLAPKS